MAVTISRQVLQPSLQITRGAAEAATALGLTLDNVLDKARKGVPFKGSHANTRYDDILFYVTENTVYGVWKREARPKLTATARPARKKPRTVHVDQSRYKDKRTTRDERGRVLATHLPCSGTGCPGCKYTGQTYVSPESYKAAAEKLFKRKDG